MTAIGGMLCIVVIAAVLAEEVPTDYCNPRLCPLETHTMCKYRVDVPAAACGEVLKVGCTKNDIEVILTLHNDHRQEVARGEVPPLPPAAFMPNLVWDKELANIAQRWANQCVYDVDECSDVGRFGVGQNMAWDESTENDTKVEDLIQVWLDMAIGIMTGIDGMLCIVVIAAVLAEVVATDYCNTEHCPPKTHTMCKYKSDEPAAECGEVLKDGCTDDDKEVIRNLHNELRQKVALGNVDGQPPADFMPDLVWDEELARIAQRSANQCTGDHDECSNVGSFDVGQNLAEEENSENDTTLEDLIYQWFNEIESFNSEEVSKYTGEDPDYDVDYYTQLVWANTTKVGCGCIKYLTKDYYNYNTVMTSLVCNYSPGGNVIGEPVYKIKK